MKIKMTITDTDEASKSEKSNGFGSISYENIGTPSAFHNEIKFDFKTPRTGHLPSLNNICSLLSNNFS